MSLETHWSPEKIFSINRLKIFSTYVLTILENIFNLFFPYVTGLAINAAIDHESFGLLCFVGVWIAHALIRVIRLRYNIRIYSAIYRDTATEIVLQQRTLNVDSSKIIARSSLSREFINFFEHDIPRSITALFSFFGALSMLFIYDVQIAVYCFLIGVPLYILNKRYARRSRQLNKGLNDQYEHEVGILSNQGRDDVWGHYNHLADWRTKLIDAQANNWGVMELFVVILVGIVIFRAGSLPNSNTGSIYSIVSYTWNFVFSLDQVPALVQQVGRLQDIKQRVLSTIKN